MSRIDIDATIQSHIRWRRQFLNAFADGAYAVGFTPPAGYLFTTSNVGDDAQDSDPLAGTNRTANFSVISGETNITSHCSPIRVSKKVLD